MMTRKKLFSNGQQGQNKQYIIFVTSKGFLIVPTFFRTDEQMVLTYASLQDDTSIRNKDKILNKINEFVLEEVGEPQTVSLSWGNDVDKVMEKLIMSS